MSVLVGRKAPDFVTSAVLSSGKIIDNFNFAQTCSGSYAVLMFYPLDFTFVCPSELIALNKRMDIFNSLNTKIFTVSIDSHFTHNAWRNTPIEKGGIGKVNYTMLSDINHNIVKSYGVEEVSAGVALRGTFLIDKDGFVRHQVVNDLPLGRDIDELIRMVKSLQFFEANGEACPAGWTPGTPGMKMSPEGVSDYLTKHATLL